jgi:hypothetical protein
LRNAVAKPEEDLTQQQIGAKAVTEKNIKLAENLEKLEKQLAETQLALSLI